VLRSGRSVEVRTPVHPDVTSPVMLHALARELAERGITRWVLQEFRPIACASKAPVAAAPRRAHIAADRLAALAARVP
jgi:pyruvate-formate lyase-activating enzyme